MVDAEISGTLTRSGLTEKEFESIRTVFRQNPDIKRVVLFGSRAKGTAQPASDIDLAIEGIKNEIEVARIAMELDELPLPYRFDVKSLDEISHLPLREHIMRVGVTIYRKI